MGYSNGKIDRTGVSIADANAVLGTSYDNVKDVCIATAMNKWSIFKPVAHTIIAGSDSGALTAVEAKGAPALINEGIIYGLKAGVDDNHWPNLHQCTYAFVGRSDGPNYPHRLSDLRGYDHNAKPTMLGSIVSQEINYNAIECADLKSNDSVFGCAGQSGDGIRFVVYYVLERFPNPYGVHSFVSRSGVRYV